MKIKNKHNLKMGKGIINGMPAMVIRGVDDDQLSDDHPDRHKHSKYVNSLIGQAMTIEDANAEHYRRVVIKCGTMEPIILQADDQHDRDFLDRITGMALLCENHEAEENCAIIRPDPGQIASPKAIDKYAHLLLDDMLDIAARRNLPVPRTILKSDLAQILDAYEKDPDSARIMAQNAKPSSKSGRTEARRAEKTVAGGVSSRSTTYNEV